MKNKLALFVLILMSAAHLESSAKSIRVFDGSEFSVRIVLNASNGRIKSLDFSASDEVGIQYWIPVSVLSAVEFPDAKIAGITLQCRDIDRVEYQLDYFTADEYMQLMRLNTAGQPVSRWKLTKEADGKELMISTGSQGGKKAKRTRVSRDA